jgi:NAD+ synthase (glutamine-hydrolysing)
MFQTKSLVMEERQLKICMAQINSTVGDLKGNLSKINNYIEKAEEGNGDIVVFPELAVTGYPPNDLLFKRDFVKKNKELLKELIKDNKSNILSIVGFVDYDGDSLYNSAAIFKKSNLINVVSKVTLPTYDVFDEHRYFKTMDEKQIKPITTMVGQNKIKLGVEICEDLWDTNYSLKVTDILVEKGADLIINLSASPFYIGKRFERKKILQKKAIENNIPIFYVNLVGGQDELVFDGQSLAVNNSGDLIAIGKQFKEDLVLTELKLNDDQNKKKILPKYNREAEVFNAIVLGLQDYFIKTGFKKAVIGLSGGIDSSVTACIAVEALGKKNVIGISMPSPFSSGHSKEDAKKLANNLGIILVQIPINSIMDAYRETLTKPLEIIRNFHNINKSSDDFVADENIQPRIRGNCLMDISNRLKKLKILVVNTGNKTELALGFCTLYGDMAGGISVLGDVSKLEVYKLANYFNLKEGKTIIPLRVFLKKPSPELKKNQFDPFDFEIVSPLVDEIIENRRSKKELIKMGYPDNIIKDTFKRIRKAEYKRWQSAPSIKITKKAFGIGWKMPIVNKYED